jgi:hypothetical protein
MHNDDLERTSEREEDRRDAVEAADDTGLVRQQELITDTELGLPVDADG